MQVFVRDNNVDQALKVLKKKMQREGIFREMRLRLRAGGGRIITRLQFLTSARSKVVLNSNSARSAFPLKYSGHYRGWIETYKRHYVHDDCRAAHLRETDCVAGHVGLELRNVVTKYSC